MTRPPRLSNGMTTSNRAKANTPTSIASNNRLRDALKDLKAAQGRAVQQERLRALGTMASGIAHDFNNALAAILGFSELLTQRPEYLEDKAKTLRYLQMINTA